MMSLAIKSILVTEVFCIIIDMVHNQFQFYFMRYIYAYAMGLISYDRSQAHIQMAYIMNIDPFIMVCINTVHSISPLDCAFNKKHKCIDLYFILESRLKVCFRCLWLCYIKIYYLICAWLSFSTSCAL